MLWEKSLPAVLDPRHNALFSRRMGRMLLIVFLVTTGCILWRKRGAGIAVPRVPYLAQDGSWEFDTALDQLNFGLSDGQCQAAFPLLYEELDRARDHLQAQSRKITKEDIHVDRDEEYSGRPHGELHVMIYDGELYVIKETPGEPDRSRGLAALASMYRAITALPNPRDIPNIEFVLDIEDTAQEPEHKADRIRWSWARHRDNPWHWVMPDFDGWAYPDDGVASYPQFRQDVAELEAEYPNGWFDKVANLSWRGSLAVNKDLRNDLITAARDQPWNDVKPIDWHSRSDVLDMRDFCRSQYVAHTEGNSWSGRLRYLQNCDSVPVIHDLDWVAHYYPILEHSGPQQNYVKVARDWSDLRGKMDELLADGQRARAIAAESTRIFRDRYLTPAAEACYWRRMFQTWRSVMAFEPQSHTEINQTRRRRGISWERFAFRAGETFEHGFVQSDGPTYVEE